MVGRVRLPMRLVTRKIWRAFPELDRFDDKHASAFVRAAGRSLWALTVRWVATLGTGLVLIVPALALAISLGGRGGTGITLAWVLGFCVLSLVAFGSAMLVRDTLLRRRVRRVIALRGTCINCRYVLLGMPVGADLKIHCPECGFVTTADPAMNELVTDAGGQVTYRPAQGADDPVRAARRARRRLRWRRGLLSGVAGLVMVAGGTLLTIYLQMLIDARAARAARNFDKDAAALMASAQPAGSEAAPNGWPVFLQVIYDVREREIVETAALAKSVQFAGVRDNELYLDYSVLFAPEPRDYSQTSEFRVEERRAADDARRKLAMAMIERLRTTGELAKLDQLRTITRVESDMVVPPGGNAVDVLLPHLAAARNVARMSAARMGLALAAKDKAEYLAALDQNLAMARILETQPTLISLLVAIAIDSLAAGRVRAHLMSIPDEGWIKDVQGVLEARRPRVGLSHALDGERLMSRDVVESFFSDTTRVRTAMLTGKVLGVTSGNNPLLARIGRYRENIEAVDADVDRGKAETEKWPFERAKPIASDGQEEPPSLMLMKMLAVAYGSAARSRDQRETELRGTRVMLTLERFKRRTGAYPAGLIELGTADGLVVGDLIDPYSGLAFGYRRLDRTAAEAKVTRGPSGRSLPRLLSDVEATRYDYLLWSVGADRTDNAGTHATSFRALHTDGANFDHVINNAE